MEAGRFEDETTGQAEEGATFDERGQLLVIDDEVEVANALHRQFRRRFDVHIATNADQALRLMLERAVHVVISDQRMPGTTGTEFFVQVRERFPHVVRLLLTGYADLDSVVAAINRGHVYRYITKPWHPDELDSIVAQSFERYRLSLRNRKLVAELQQANELLERRVAERTAELSKINQQLTEAVEQRDRILSIAAHDLRNPLTVISSFARLLGNRGLLNEHESDEALESIARASSTMLELIDGLLDIAQIERGLPDLRLVEVELESFFRPLLARNERIAADKGIALEHTIDPTLRHWRFDPNRIEQVLNNLVGNAVKFSDSGTTVQVSVERGPDRLLISVSDQGLGIDPAELPGIFGEFARTSTRPTGGERSTGLGLAICRRIVTLHRGVIHVRSEPGVGSCFTVELPAGDPEAQP